MAVSKRTRFEVFRRDGFKCRYCGLAGPDGAGLTIDHVTPVSLGGGDDPANLWTACKDCNSGKASSSPDAPMVAQVSDDAVRWAAAMKVAADEMARNQGELQEYRRQFLIGWQHWDKPLNWLDSEWRGSLGQFHRAGLPIETLIDDVHIAWGNRRVPTRGAFKYLCGIAWNQITELQERATALAARAPTSPTSIDRDEDGDEEVCELGRYVHEHARFEGEDNERVAAAARRVIGAVAAYYSALEDRAGKDFAYDVVAQFFQGSPEVAA